jgi:hypothetical protein
MGMWTAMVGDGTDCRRAASLESLELFSALFRGSLRWRIFNLGASLGEKVLSQSKPNASCASPMVECC